MYEKTDTKEQNQEKECAFDYFDRAVERLLFTSAIPILFDAETFVCSVSILDRYVPLYTIW